MDERNERTAASWADCSLLLILLKAMHHRCLVLVFLRLICGILAPDFMGAVTSSFDFFLHYVSGYHFQIVRPANLRAKINERCRYVESIVAQLGRLVVPREHVVIIVPALPECQEGYTQILRGIDEPEISDEFYKIALLLYISLKREKLID